MDILKTGEVCKANTPSQTVLRLVKPGTYATHIIVTLLDSEPYFILGNYFFKLEDAEVSFERRLIELRGS